MAFCLRLILFVGIVLALAAGLSGEQNALQVVEPIQKGDTLFVGVDWYLRNPESSPVPKSSRDLPFVATDSAVDSGIVFNSSVIVAMMGSAFHPESEIHLNHVAIAWFGFGEGNQNIFVSRSSDHGVTWSDSLRLSPLGTAGHEFSNIDGNDSLVFVVWKGGSHDSSYMRMAGSGGGDWSPLMSIAGYLQAGPHGAYRPDVAADEVDLIVTYEGEDLNGFNQRSKRGADYGTSWSIESIVGGVASGKGAEIALADSVTHVIRGSSGSTEVRYNRSTDLGTTWSDDSFISDLDGEYSQWPSVAADPYGFVYATWFDYKDSPFGGTGYLFFRRSSDHGLSWDSIRYLSTEPLATWSDIYADSVGVYVVWSRNEYPKQCYFRTSLDRGLTWSEEKQLGDPLADISEPEIDGDGRYLSVSARTLRSGQYIAPTHILGGRYTVGDANGDQIVNISDPVYLINHIFAGGNPPILTPSGDFNHDAITNISDVVSMINFIFGGGSI